jgi:predicted transcriptional regulator
MPNQLLMLASQIVSAVVANNTVETASLPDLIREVYQTLLGLESGSDDGPQPITQTPAVPIEASVFHDFIVCLEDGKKLRTLKRYLMTKYGLTPEQYRAKWGLPANYPMICPGYAKARSTLAKSMGLGKRQ